MLYSYEQLLHEISMWDLRQQESGAVSADESMLQMLNHTDLSGSRMSVPDHSSHHSVIQILNPPVGHGSTPGDPSRDVLSIEVLAIPPHKTSDYGGGSDGRSILFVFKTFIQDCIFSFALCSHKLWSVYSNVLWSLRHWRIL